MVASVLLAVAGAAAEQKAGNPKKLAPPPKIFKGLGKANLPKGGGPRMNPANQFERLIAMPPERREQVIEKLPPAQQQRLRARLNEWDQLPAPQKAMRLELLNRYASLPAEKQPAYLRQIDAVNNLEPERRKMVIRELRMLWRMPDAQRQSRLASDDYKARFSPGELEMLNAISAANPMPGQ